MSAMRPRRHRIRTAASFDTFSQIHLATAAERAVYRCFARDPEAYWSDTEVAFATRLEISAVRWALARFEDAGLVEEVEEACYRWRPKHRYILDRGEPAGGMRDPVCGMRVGIDAEYRAEDVFGGAEYFCSERCMAAFLVWPLAFTPLRGTDADRSEDRHAL